MRKKKRERRRLQGDVELNLAAMLDMAFQLLAFFILTFKPAPVEGQIALRMPAPQPISKPAEETASGSNEAETISLQGVETLSLRAQSDGSGGIKSLRIAQGEPTNNLQVFEERLSAIFADPAIPFQQVILEVGSNLRYDFVMQLLDICARVKLPSGERLSQLSFVEIPEQADSAADPAADTPADPAAAGQAAPAAAMPDPGVPDPAPAAAPAQPAAPPPDGK